MTFFVFALNNRNGVLKPQHSIIQTSRLIKQKILWVKYLLSRVSTVVFRIEGGRGEQGSKSPDKKAKQVAIRMV